MPAVILVEPEGALNIGTVCRAMMNMNAGPLILVNPQADHLSPESYRFALHASQLLEDAIIAKDLSSVLSDFEFSIAITRRVSQRRKKDFEPTSLAKYLAHHTTVDVCLVFGRESTGLTTAEVSLCDAVCSIPSHSSYPSLNLSHAVMVILYEIYRASVTTEENTNRYASPIEIREMIQNIETTFREAGFFKKHPSENLMKYFQKVLTRQQPQHYETIVISNAFKRLRGKILDLKKKFQND